MKFLEFTFDEPAANLACDEALLEMMEADVSRDSYDDCLRIWEAKKYFVVLGHSERVKSSVNVAACNGHSIPILRRISGGGTVVQGPGCLNYSLILKNSACLKNIRDTFKYVLERHRSVVEEISGAPARLEGISDLTADGLKFSGNAQYRKARFVLVHGTFLLNFDLSVIETLLPVPAKQPAYRRRRPHLEFIMNLPVDPSQLCDRLKHVWGCGQDRPEVPFARIDELVRDRYGRIEWTEKF
jgi:lipoate-protein ligase A